MAIQKHCMNDGLWSWIPHSLAIIDNKLYYFMLKIVCCSQAKRPKAGRYNFLKDLLVYTEQWAVVFIWTVLLEGKFWLLKKCLWHTPSEIFGPSLLA